MERDKYFSSLWYSNCEGFNSLFSAETQKKILSDHMSEKKKKAMWIPRLGSELMVSAIDLKFTFYSKIFLSL